MAGTVLEKRAERRAQAHAATRESILKSARRVAAREGARNLSLRSVASEAGFAPAALYGYFASKDELLLALAADDLGAVARAMREATRDENGAGRLAAVAAVALNLLRTTETLAAALGALSQSGHEATHALRVFNGRLISALNALSEATNAPAEGRDGQRDVVLLAGALAGLALLARSGRLEALGFSTEELIERLEARFSGG
jgi:AcrR family transcriptional regulator